MLRIGPVELGRRPALVAVVSREDDISGLKASTLSEVDVFEVRADMFSDPSVPRIRPILRMARDQGKGVLLTVRSSREGGGANLSENERHALFNALQDDCDAMDLEVESTGLWPALSDLCRRKGNLLIGSYHDFASTPDDGTMEMMMNKAFEQGSHIFKLACMAASQADVVRLLDFTRRNTQRGLVTLSMGAWGLMSRVVGPAFGSLLTYGFISSASAPGQLPIDELALRLREFLPSRL